MLDNVFELVVSQEIQSIRIFDRVQIVVVLPYDTLVKTAEGLEVGDEFSFADLYFAKVVSKEKAEKNEIILGIKFAGAHGNLRGMTIRLHKSVPMRIVVFPTIKHGYRNHQGVTNEHVLEIPPYESKSWRGVE